LTLSGGSYPDALPVFLDFSNLQNIPPDQEVVFSWTPFLGAAASDYVQLEIYGLDAGAFIFRTPNPWQAGTLPETATSVTVPAGTFVPYEIAYATLTFGHVVASDNTQVPGANGLAVYLKRTEVELLVGAGDTTGTDLTPPGLLRSIPADGVVKVPPTASLSFTFSEPMAEGSSIAWGAGLNDPDFDYTWNEDQQTLTCTPLYPLPENNEIAWVLNPSSMSAGFMDLAGSLLAMDAYSGSFTTRVRIFAFATSMK